MIASNMKNYPYYLYLAPDEYGQQELSTVPNGSIRMSIYLSSQSVQNNINYKDCQYVGLTQDSVSDSYVIEYENKRLKVMCINNAGRYTQAFLIEI